MSAANPVIVWFRQDLRLADNPAFDAAIAMDAPVLPVYVLDDVSAGKRRAGAASRWWLHHSLNALRESLDRGLVCLRGDASQLIPQLAEEVKAVGVFWNRCYEPWRIERDKRIKAKLLRLGHLVRSFNGSLLFEPPHITKRDGTPYKVFTPFYRKGCLEAGPAPRKSFGSPAEFTVFRSGSATSVEDLRLLPEIRWYEEMAAQWTPGESGARERLDTFLTSGLASYKQGRDRPDQDFVSRLSPHIHFGEISPHTVWHATKKYEGNAEIADDVDHFLSELGWREFSHYLLYYWPTLPEVNLQKKFDRFPWRNDGEALDRWRRGLTGYPIVDAGMRELWRTGYMHNRVRMIVGSFLVKNLLLDWRHGEAWFWDTLVDADLANNSAGWQWIAGCGADAAPYFRVFNPVTQGKKFDPEGRYVRRYVPEIATVPDSHLHNPWDAPAELLHDAGVKLGRDYPLPIVELKASRKRALDAFKRLSVN